MESSSSVGAQYDSAFFEGQASHGQKSARKVVPIVLDALSVRSVVDIGGGVGPWARAFLDSGVDRVICVDGAYVDRQMLLVPEAAFVVRDVTKPLDLGERFDLAVSLEVAEHLPPDSGDAFVRELVALAPAVLFSAAIPHQGGVNHTNERWQSYWAGLFARHGYVLLDIVRPRVWDDPDVMPWYAQNTFLYVNEEIGGSLGDAALASTPLDVVAPRFYLYQRHYLVKTPEPSDAARVLVKSLNNWARSRARQSAPLRRLRGR